MWSSNSLVCFLIRALVKRQPCNLGKPLDLHDDKSQHRVNIPAIHCHPSLLTQHLTNHLDGSQTPQPNDWPPIQPHSSVLLGSLGALTGNDQMLTSTSMGINCKPKTNAVQRGGRQHCSRPSHHANSTGQFQMNRQINGDVSLLLQQQQQQQQALVVSQYSVPNGLMATVVDMQSQQIMKQSGMEREALLLVCLLCNLGVILCVCFVVACWSEYLLSACCLPVCLVILCIYLSVCLSVYCLCLSIVCLSVCLLSVCLSVCLLSVYLSVCLCLMPAHLCNLHLYLSSFLPFHLSNCLFSFFTRSTC